MNTYVQYIDYYRLSPPPSLPPGSHPFKCWYPSLKLGGGGHFDGRQRQVWVGVVSPRLYLGSAARCSPRRRGFEWWPP